MSNSRAPQNEATQTAVTILCPGCQKITPHTMIRMMSGRKDRPKPGHPRIMKSTRVTWEVWACQECGREREFNKKYHYDVPGAERPARTIRV